MCLSDATHCVLVLNLQVGSFEIFGEIYFSEVLVPIENGSAQTTFHLIVKKPLYKKHLRFLKFLDEHQKIRLDESIF